MQSHYLRRNDLQGLQEELEAVRNESNYFIYAVSHDFAAPLRAVAGFSLLLQKECEGVLNEKSKRYLEFIISGGAKAQAMLQGLLKYSRLNTQSGPSEIVEVSWLIGKCRSELKDRIKQCRGAIHIEGALPAISVDVEQFSLLFMVLLDNALTYYRCGVPPQVHCSAEESEFCWKFMIRDNGIGIESQSSTRIFELFRRLHTDEEYAGVGVGLTLAKRVVERHGGTIGVSSAQGGGSIFWFTVPKQHSGGDLG